MSVIYEPRGKAGEYSELACNLFTGCCHGCLYCYCPAIMRTSLEAWRASPRPRKDILRLFEREAQALAGDTREILFSFMCDPYQNPAAAEYTRQALAICERYHLRVQVLTKNPAAALADVAMFQRNDWKLGSTIIFTQDASRAEWEPNAPPIRSRCLAVKAFHDEGVFTWISLEPVIDTSQAIDVVRRMKPYVDLWKVGRWNHDSRAADIDWAGFLVDIEAALLGCDYYIKEDLRKFSA